LPDGQNSGQIQVLTNFPWAEKMEGRKMTKFLKKWPEAGWKTFYNYLEANPLNYL
jgi:hypothetical protein